MPRKRRKTHHKRAPSVVPRNIRKRPKYERRVAKEGPVFRLPVELLEHIFLFCLSPENWPAPDLAPVFLSHVCGLWRIVALKLPFLWSSIVDKDEFMIKSWLIRASTAPNLRVNLQYNWGLELIQIQVIPRCIFLILELSEWSTVEASRVDFTTSRLKSIELQLSLVSKRAMQTLDAISTAASAAPNLTEIKYMTSEISLSSSLLIHKWPKLTSLTITAMVPASQFLPIASHLPQLTHLSINLGEASEGSLSQTRYIEFDLLQFLSITVKLGPLGPFFAALKLPSLTYLCVRGDQNAEEMIEVVIRDFLSCLKHPLKILDLYVTELVVEEFIKALPQPTLTEHCITELRLREIYDTTLRFLATSKSLCHLQKIYLDDVTSSDKVVSDMLESLWTNGPLKFASVGFSLGEYRKYHKKDIIKFGVLFEKGLDIMISGLENRPPCR